MRHFEKCRCAFCDESGHKQCDCPTRAPNITNPNWVRRAPARDVKVMKLMVDIVSKQFGNAQLLQDIEKPDLAKASGVRKAMQPVTESGRKLVQNKGNEDR